MPMARSYFFLLCPKAFRTAAFCVADYDLHILRGAKRTADEAPLRALFPGRRPGGKGSKLSNLALQAILADVGFGQGCEDQDAPWIGTRMSREQLGMCTYAYVLTAVNSVGGEA